MRREQLNYLIELSKNHSIHQASEKFNISPQALGASIRALETELAVTLLLRSRTGVQLTDEGKAVIRLGRSFWQGIDHLTAANNSLFVGTLELYVTYGCLNCFIPQLIAELSEVYPDLNLNVHEMDETELITQIKKKAIPYALTMRCFINDEPFLPLDAELSFVPFALGKLYAMVSNKSPLCDYKQISIKTLLKQPLLLHSPCNMKTSVYPLLLHYGKPEQCELEYNHIVYKSKMVTGQNIGLGFSTPFQVAHHYSGFLKNIPVKENIYMYIGYVTLKDSSASDEIQRLLARLNFHPIQI